MKRFIIGFALSLCLTAGLQAQDSNDLSRGVQLRIGDMDISVKPAPFKQGDWELSATGSFGKTTVTTKSTFNDGNVFNDTNSETYLFLSVAADYYIADRLSIEPELSMLSMKESTGETAILNVSYTYLPEKSSTAYYIRGGYGLGNSFALQTNPEMPFEMDSKFDVGTVNGGIGCKFIVVQNVALRTELNYQYRKSSGGTNSFDRSSSTVRLLFGFSILP